MQDKPQGAATPVIVDTGLACLVMLARFHNLAASAEQMAYEYLDSNQQFTATQLLLAAQQLGLKAKAVHSTVERLAHLPMPSIAVGNDGQFFILARMEQDTTLIHDPRQQRPEALGREALAARWSGELILVRSEAALVREASKFDFTWFIPAIVKYRKLLGEVLLVSFVLQIFALLTPLFFQVVMDKVLVHRGLTTLDVIAVGLLGIMLFESALSGLRTYVFSHTASRIDVELGSRLFRHLVTLPLAYFQARRVGDSVARVRELEQIRSFLTGNSITLILDVLFWVVFVAVMFVYSGWLTLVVLLSLPLYFLISLLVTPPLRARLNESFSRGAENQAFVVGAI
jgi:subfamily B ATP-binding cassette protein HlyB/CyaB